MVLFHEKGKVWKFNERRKLICHFCKTRLAEKDFETNEVSLIDHYEDSVFGFICVPCFKKRVEGENGSWNS